MASDYAIAVFDEDAPDVSLACGEIGGIREDDRTMIIGLWALNDSLYSGIATLTQGERSTNVTVYLALDLAGSGIEFSTTSATTTGIP